MGSKVDKVGGFKPPLLGLRSALKLDRLEHLASLFEENFARFDKERRFAIAVLWVGFKPPLLD